VFEAACHFGEYSVEFVLLFAEQVDNMDIDSSTDGMSIMFKGFNFYTSATYSVGRQIHYFFDLSVLAYMHACSLSGGIL